MWICNVFMSIFLIGCLISGAAEATLLEFTELVAVRVMRWW